MKRQHPPKTLLSAAPLKFSPCPARISQKKQPHSKVPPQPALSSKPRLASTILSTAAAVLLFSSTVSALDHQSALPAPETVSSQHLPAPLSIRISDRAAIDRYQAETYAPEEIGPVPYQPKAVRPNERRRSIRVVAAPVSDAVLQYRRQFFSQAVPLRGFRAPILNHAEDFWPPHPPTNGFSADATRAATLIQARLAKDRLLPTLVHAVIAWGQSFPDDPVQAANALRSVGFPVDLLACFSAPDAPQSTDSFPPLWHSILAQIRQRPVDELLAQAELAIFRFIPSQPGFHIAPETGTAPIATVRAQLGGGYVKGIVPGANIDVLGQLIQVLPNADFVISVPGEFFEPIRWLAGRTWPLQRANHVTLISEPFPVTAWAQDNGKPGFILRAGALPAPALLTPRYASMDESVSTLVAGDSFLMDGLRAAGVAVAQSPLLFQGGNLLAVREPRSHHSILLIGESEIQRNVALGLSAAQVQEAFCAEFGASQCRVIPAASYHLDFDFAFRSAGSELIAFVNDPSAAARVITGAGIDALAQGAILSPSDVASARRLIDHQDYQTLRALLDPKLRTPGGYSSATVRLFASAPSDSASGNFRLFLIALDLLESAQRIPQTSRDPNRAEYLAALQRLHASSREQRKILDELGCRVVPVPSLPDLRWTINYLNAIQEPARYIMPVYGGFFKPLDDAAAAGLRAGLPPGVQIVPVLCSESQRNHGALHCLVSVFPSEFSSPLGDRSPSLVPVPAAP